MSGGREAVPDTIGVVKVHLVNATWKQRVRLSRSAVVDENRELETLTRVLAELGLRLAVASAA